MRDLSFLLTLVAACHLVAHRVGDYQPCASAGGCSLIRYRTRSVGREPEASTYSRARLSLLIAALLVCARCGYAYCGRTNDERNAYYRCAGAKNLPRQGFERVCWNKELRMDQTDASDWQEVCSLLENPERLEQEYRQRLQPQQQPKEHGF